MSMELVSYLILRLWFGYKNLESVSVTGSRQFSRLQCNIIRYNQSVYNDLNGMTAGARQSAFIGRILIS